MQYDTKGQQIAWYPEAHLPYTGVSAIVCVCSVTTLVDNKMTHIVKPGSCSITTLYLNIIASELHLSELLKLTMKIDNFHFQIICLE